MKGDILGIVVFGFVLLIGLAVITALVILVSVFVKALIRYINTKEVRQEKNVIKKSLGETIKHHREACKMTQEFVAEAIGVSRQAVSKWENGTSDPSTSNLVAIAKLFSISAEDLLNEVE